MMLLSVPGCWLPVSILLGTALVLVLGVGFSTKHHVPLNEVQPQPLPDTAVRDAPKRVLYAVPNTEGLARQLGSLSCYLELARATNRELVMMPILSYHHYGEGIALDDYVDNQGGRWRTVREDDDTSLFADKDDTKHCAYGFMTNARKFSRVEPGTANPAMVFNINEKRAVRHMTSNAPTIDALAAEIDRRAVTGKGGASYACVLMIQRTTPACNGGSFAFRPSRQVEDVARKALANLYGSANAEYRAVHLRRGDRCNKGKGGDEVSVYQKWGRF